MACRQGHCILQLLGFAYQHKPTFNLNDREQSWCSLLLDWDSLLPSVGWIYNRWNLLIHFIEVIIVDESWDQQGKKTITIVLLGAVDYISQGLS